MQPGRLPENSNEGKWIAYVERLGAYQAGLFQK